MEEGSSSNLEGKSKQSDDNGTEMTEAESLDLSLDAYSISESENDCEVQHETKKERNRRLLLQHQKSYVRPVKGRIFKHPSNSLRREERMQGIKEEDARDENHLSKLEISPITRANKSEKAEMNSDDTLRQIRQIIKRKAKRSKKKSRQTRKKSKTLHPL